MAKLPLVEVPIGDYGTDQAAMARYRAEGADRAMALGNRGPIRYDAGGRLAADILDAYDEHGFYVFEGVLSRAELDEIERDLAAVMDRLPIHKDAAVDAQGREALGVGLDGRNVVWVEPLSDPVGGTDANYGRHQAKMIEPQPPEGAPDHVVQVILGSLQFSEAVLRVYGHPDLLRVAAAIHGPDFTPFNEALFIKQPGLGGSVAWHQDPWTHWDSPDLDGNTHGFNFMGQLYGSTPANGLWVVPGSHLGGKADIAGMVAAAGSDRLPDAVPLVCAPGDVGICNRQAIHGSFANTSPDPRVTINMGFHRRSSVLGVESGGVHNPISVYTPERIDKRSEVIAYAIDARAQHYPDEARYVYEPFAGREDNYRFGPGTLDALRDYNLLDLGI
ncbi:MAG: phytanoyl-CoA dioxygenase family protein [Actinomycetota bacterium]